MKKDIAVILHTTFTRFPMAKVAIESFRNNPRMRLYISDTGEITNEKLEYYKDVELQGHKAFFTGWDTSPAITRNFLVDQIKEPYVLKVDDDFKYTDDLRVDDAIKLLENNPNIGLCGFAVKSADYKSQFIFDAARRKENNGKSVIKLEAVQRQPLEFQGIRYLICDVTPDAWVARRGMFPDCGWDERYHVSEGLHTDFFLHIKFNSTWKVAYMPDCKMYTFKHDPEFKVPDEERKKSFYNKKRFRNLNNIKQFCEKWGVEEINRW